MGQYFLLLPHGCVSWLANLKVNATCWHGFVDWHQENQENSKRSTQEEGQNTTQYVLWRLDKSLCRRKFLPAIQMWTIPWGTARFTCWVPASHSVGRQDEFKTWQLKAEEMESNSRWPLISRSLLLQLQYLLLLQAIIWSHMIPRKTKFYLRGCNKAQETFSLKRHLGKLKQSEWWGFLLLPSARGSKGNQNKGTKKDSDCRWSVSNTGMIFQGRILWI